MPFVWLWTLGIWGFHTKTHCSSGGCSPLMRERECIVLDLLVIAHPPPKSSPSSEEHESSSSVNQQESNSNLLKPVKVLHTFLQSLSFHLHSTSSSRHPSLESWAIVISEYIYAVSLRRIYSLKLIWFNLMIRMDWVHRMYVHIIYKWEWKKRLRTACLSACWLQWRNVNEIRKECNHQF